MAHRVARLAVGTVLACTFVAALIAQDLAGSRDHPLVKRMAGSQIVMYSARDFDEYYLFCGVPPAKAAVNIAQNKQVQHVEGKLTRIRYKLPSGTSTLEGIRQYQTALSGSGFDIVKTYGPTEIDERWLASAVNQAGDDWVRYPFGPGQPRYLCAKATRPQGDVIVTVFVFNGGDPYAVVDVVEPKGMTNKMVDPDAGTMAKRIAASGHVELYGIYFDVDKATIQPESGATLEQVAALLKNDASLKLSVVGHTDNAGTAAHNQQLSEARAQAVVNELATRYGIAAARLQAVGKGSTAPVAPNTTEAGRAKNRRVELVKR